MLEAREIAEWNRAAQLITAVANQFRGRDQRPVELADVHPYYHRLKRPESPFDDVAEDLSILKRVFVDQRPQG